MCQTTKKEQKCVYFLLLPFVYPNSARPCPYAFLSIIHYPMLNSFYTGLWELLLELPPCPTHGDSDIVLDPTRECVDISNSVPRSSASRNILTS